MGERNPESGVQWLDRGFTLPVGVDMRAAQGATVDAPPAPSDEVTDDPALELIATGLIPRRLGPEIDGAIYRFDLATPTDLVWLLSRSSTPQEMVGSADKRRLGVPVSRIAVDGWDIALDDAAFREGWHAPESGFRWSNGRAALSLRRPARRIEIELNGYIPLRYRQTPDAVLADSLPAMRRRAVTPATLAVITTMAHDDPEMLAQWLRHYGAQVGPEHCYVATADPVSRDISPANLIRLPAPAIDAGQVARFASALCAALLVHYDHAACTALDEMLVADPRYFDSLPEFCTGCPHDVVTAIGLEIVHVRRDEPALDPGRPVLLQRRWVNAVSSLCKPMLTRRPVAWSAGFARADAPLAFHRLFNFRIGRADTDLALLRAAEPDRDGLARLMESRADLPPVGGIDLDTDCPDTRRFVQRVAEAALSPADDAAVSPQFEFVEEQLWRVPERFRNRL